ncbi:Mfa1 family fimbria major subunit [Bacteroides sp.]
MKKYYYLMVAFAALIFAACAAIDETENENGGGNGNGAQNMAYASVSFTIPASAATRATEDGTAEEQKIKDVAVLTFGGTPVVLTSVNILARDKFSPTNSGISTNYGTLESIRIPVGEQKVYIVVNPTSYIRGLVKADGVEALNLTDFETKTLTDMDGYAVDNAFLMTNAEAAPVIVPTEKNDKTNPVTVSVKVERTAAKVTYHVVKTNNAYEVKNDKDQKVADVKIEQYKVINMRSEAYYLRRVGTAKTDAVLGAPEADGKYVIEPAFDKKTGYVAADWGTYYKDEANYTALSKATTDSKLVYCLENTALQQQQWKGYLTGVSFKATYTPVAGSITGTNANGTFYRFGGELFATLEALVKAYNPDWTPGTKDNLVADVLNIKSAQDVNSYLAALADNSSDLGSLGVDYFKNGICYYTYYIRHNNNNKPQEMGVMEFAIVRNNVYKLSINSVTRLGTPGEKPNPEEPGESGEAALNVNVQVLPWTVRENEIDF